MSAQTVTETASVEAPPCWPPLAHMTRKSDGPVREGILALCGAKLMGIDLGDPRGGRSVCFKCYGVFCAEAAKVAA